MKKTLSLASVLVGALMLFSFLSSVPSMGSENTDIQKLIQNAITAEDHSRIAEYYEKQARKAETSARFHASMGDSYNKRHKPLKGLAKHCTNLSNKYEEAAKEYSTLAFEHRKIAAELKTN